MAKVSIFDRICAEKTPNTCNGSHTLRKSWNFTKSPGYFNRFQMTKMHHIKSSGKPQFK